MKPSILIAIVAFVPLGLADAHEHGDHHHDCVHVDGPFSSTLVPPPTCTSAVGLCTHGLLTGDLDATYDFTFDTLAPANDPTNPGLFVYTGHSVITPSRGAHEGQMFSNDHGWLEMNPDPTGLSQFQTTAEIASGTRRFEDTRGTLVASGQISFVTGDATGSYTGQLCDDDDHGHDHDCDHDHDRD